MTSRGRKRGRLCCSRRRIETEIERALLGSPRKFLNAVYHLQFDVANSDRVAGGGDVARGEKLDVRCSSWEGVSHPPS